jgi:hypothetical protein
LAFRSATAGLRPKVSTKTEGVHVQVSHTSSQNQPEHQFTLVQMETFESPTDKAPYLAYDAAGNPKGDNYDPEAQHISDEFKRPPY